MGANGHTLRSQDDPYLIELEATERHQLNRPMMRRQMILVIFCLEVDIKVCTYVVMHFVPLMLCTDGGFTKPVKQTIQLKTKLLQWGFTKLF